MPSFKISDGVNAALDVTPNANSALIKYFKNLSDLSVSGAQMALKSGTTLADPTVSSVTAGMTFAQPIDVGTSQVDLKIGGGLSGSLGVFVPRGSAPKLFDPDPYNDPILVAPDDRYVSFEILASVNDSVAATSGDLKFGFTGGGSVALTNYRRFTVKPIAPQLVDAIRETVAQFTIPADIEDLEALTPGQIVTINGTGTIKFSATADLLTAVNPLASASLPAPLPTVAIKAGGSVTVGADVQLTGEYQIRVSKVDAKQVQLAYYRKSGEALGVKVTASVGLSADIGGGDVIGKLMSAISSDAKADTDELKKANLGDAEIKGIQEAIKASITRTLEIAVSAELAATQEHEAAFLYDIDLSSLTAASRAAIHSALDGDLSSLTIDPSSPLPGIVYARDLFSAVRQRKYSLNVNLLGIVNYGWVSKLITSGKTIYEPTTGQLVISDSATASRISTLVANIGVADPDKLRQAMAENFLITIAYRGARRAGLAPALTTSHSFFALNQHTSQETLRDELDVSVALGLLDEKLETKSVTSAPEFGRTLYYASYYASTGYDSTLSTSLFLDGNHPRAVEFYEQAGLEAVACLIRPGDSDSARLRPTKDAELWKKMKDAGQPGIKWLFPGVPDPVVGAIIADYSLICWWSEAMNETAKKLAAMQGFLSSHPTADDQNNEFKKLRSDLADHLSSVAANTKEDFGRPWGLLAMFIASGKRAECKTMLVGRNLSISLQRSIRTPEQLGAIAA